MSSTYTAAVLENELVIQSPGVRLLHHVSLLIRGLLDRGSALDRPLASVDY